MGVTGPYKNPLFLLKFISIKNLRKCPINLLLSFQRAYLLLQIEESHHHSNFDQGGKGLNIHHCKFVCLERLHLLFVSEIMRISTLLLISSFRGSNLFLIGFIFTWPKITLFLGCKWDQEKLSGSQRGSCYNLFYLQNSRFHKSLQVKIPPKTHLRPSKIP